MLLIMHAKVMNNICTLPYFFKRLFLVSFFKSWFDKMVMSHLTGKVTVCHNVIFRENTKILEPLSLQRCMKTFLATCYMAIFVFCKRFTF